MDKVVLTGYAGFIGSQILRDLIDKGYFVIGIDNLSEGSDIDNYSEVRENFLPVIADLSDPRLSDILDHVTSKFKIKYVINCAADSHVDRSWGQINKFIDSNIKGSLNLANWALTKKVEKFVQVSTDEVWGGAAQPYNEQSIFCPENIYSTSKASAEMFLKNFEKAYGLPLVITNGANTYGKRQMVEKLIPKTVFNITNGFKVPVYQTPAQRMWLHVEDHSAGIISAMKKGKIGEKYCLAPDISQEKYTLALVSDICSIMGVNTSDVVEMVPDRLNYDLRYFMSNDKAKAEIGFKPQKKLSEELPAVVYWFKSKFNENSYNI
jgi:dTDP-glucose 4,6-dehydratase